MADAVAKKKAPAKPRKAVARKTATTKEKVVPSSRLTMPPREEIEKLAKRYWEQRGYVDGYAEQDWLRAERELLGMAS